MGRALRRFIYGLALTLAAAPSLAVAGAGLSVELHLSRRVAIRGEAASVIVGDPTIALVNVVDVHSIVLTGQKYGSTNVIVLDGHGRTLLDSRLDVVSGAIARVTVYSGDQSTSYNCSPHCENAALSSANNGGTSGAPAAPGAAPIM